MKKLLWVLAFGLMGVLGAVAQEQTVNMAPMIGDLPTPVVGDDDISYDGKFVYTDALDLNTLAVDDWTSAAGLKWSYSIIGTPRYLINGVAPLNNLLTTSPTSPRNPPIGLQINKTVAGGEMNPDGKANTITIRNKTLSPLSGSTTTPTATGVLASETQPVTFFCSDGNTYSSQTIFFYTDNGGNDRISGGFIGDWPRVDKITRFWRKTEWNALGATGTNFRLTTSTVPGVGAGVCLIAGQKGWNWGALVSSYPYFNLAANQVYRIKLKMVGSQATGGKTPYWNLIIENYDDLHPAALNLYSFTTGIYDVQGGANALTTTARTVTLYWAPPAVSTPQWNDPLTGAFTSRLDTVNDPRLRFRVIDVDSYGEGELRSGNLCIQEIEVTPAPLSRCQVTQSLVNITKFVEATVPGASGKNVRFSPLLGSDANFSNGTVTISPRGDSQMYELAFLGPSTDNRYDGDPAKAYNYDEYPIMWKTGKILRMQADLSAPTIADENTPWDAICFLLLAFDNEVNAESWITANQKCGSPRFNSVQTYTAFFSTHNETQSLISGYHRLRWELRFANTLMVNYPNGATLNTGSVKVSGFRVDEVEFR